MYLRLFILVYLIAFSSHALEAKNKKVLDLRQQGLTDLSDIEVPQVTRKLLLSRNRITSLDGLSLPQGLRKLTLSINNIESLEDFNPNPKLNYISLTGNPGIDLSNFPSFQELKTFYAGGCELNQNTLDLNTLPHTLETLGLSANLYESFDLSSYENMKLLHMNSQFSTFDGGDGRDMDYSLFTFPPNLEELRVGNVTRSDDFTTLTLPQTLKKLNLFAAFLTNEEFQTLTLSPNLEVINLKLNRLTTLDGIEFPDTIRKLNLQRNSFSKEEKRKIRRRFGKKVKIKF